MNWNDFLQSLRWSAIAIGFSVGLFLLLMGVL